MTPTNPKAARSAGDRWELRDVLACEHRDNRAYDDADPSHLLMPNGSLVASFDRGFLGVALREVFTLHVPVEGAA